MRFAYEYRTSDNVRHTGAVVASDREAAFQSLKSQGIRPGRLTEAPGFFNKLFGKGKRWLTIGVLGALCLVLCALALHYSHEARSTKHEARSTPLMRRQVYGDPALMRELARSDYATVFDTEADRFLARYAQPATVPPTVGADHAARSTKHEARSTSLAALVAANYQPPIAFKPNDPREVTELKRIVLWMRQELKDYLANGIGTTESYARRLDERLKEELLIYQRIKNELSRTKDDSAWEKGNATLRAIGAPTIPRPEENEKLPSKNL